MKPSTTRVAGLHPLAAALAPRTPLLDEAGRPVVLRGRPVYRVAGAAEVATFAELLALMAASDEAVDGTTHLTSDGRLPGLTAEQTTLVGDYIAAADTVEACKELQDAITALAADDATTASALQACLGVLTEVTTRTAEVQAGTETPGGEEPEEEPGDGGAGRDAALEELNAALDAANAPATDPTVPGSQVPVAASGGRVPAATTNYLKRPRTPESLARAKANVLGHRPTGNGGGAGPARPAFEAFSTDASDRHFGRLKDAVAEYAAHGQYGGALGVQVSSLPKDRKLYVARRALDPSTFDDRIEGGAGQVVHLDEDRIGRAVAAFRKRKAEGRTSALAASGGPSGPNQVLYGIKVPGSTRMPFEEALPSIEAQRAGIQYRFAPTIPAAGQSGTLGFGVNSYSVTQDTAGVTKDLGSYILPPPLVAFLTAYYERIEVGNLAALLDPEGLQAVMDVQDIVASRLMEQGTFARLQAMSLATRVHQQYMGTVADVLSAIVNDVSDYSWRQRADRDATTFELFTFVQLADLVAADVARSKIGGTDGALESITDEEVVQAFLKQGVDPTFGWDLANAFSTTQFAGGTNGAPAPAPRIPASIPYVLFPEGHALQVKGPDLKLGLYRDSATNARNAAQTFFEAQRTTIQVGPEIIAGVFQTQPNGARAADRAIDGFNQGTADNTRTPAAVG